MTKHSSGRRKDSLLRAAIERVQQRSEQKLPGHTLIQHVLDEYLGVTGCRFSCLILPRQQRRTRLLLQIASVRVMGDPPIPLSASPGSRSGLHLPTSLDESSHSGLYHLYAHPDIGYLTQPDLLPEAFNELGWEYSENVLALPLERNGQVAGLVILSGGHAALNAALAERIWPLTTLFAGLLRGLHAQIELPVQPRRNSDTAESAYESMQHFIEFCPMAVFEVDRRLQIVRVNLAAEQLFQRKAHELEGQSIGALLPERVKNEHRMHTFAPAFNKGGQPYQRRFAVRLPGHRKLNLIATVIPGVDESLANCWLVLTDESELQHIRDAQQTQIQRFRAVADLAPVGILQTNLNWECTYVNDRWSEISGMPQEETPRLGWINAFYHGDILGTLSQLRQAVSEAREFSGECRLQQPSGDVRWVTLNARPLFTAHHIIDGMLVTITDITFRRETEMKLRDMAELDSLTKLANRYRFLDRLDLAIRSLDESGSLALLCLDLDGFKNVNDSLGHDAGDTLLKDVSDRLLSCVSVDDMVARVGGDEFMVLVESAHDIGMIHKLAHELLHTMSQPFILNGHEVFISTSVGITLATRGMEIDATGLIKQADLALYRAKGSGRNNFQFFSPELERRSRERLTLSTSLHKALDRSEFRVAYQFQRTMDRHRLVGSEALLRWDHPERGMLKPTHFVPLLEETRLINPVSRWLFHEAFRAHRGWIDEGLMSPDTHVSVNLSPRQLHDASLVAAVEGALKDARLDGRQVVVEITESALMDDSRTQRLTLERLKSLDIQIALDDFGTGYSSLTYLRQYPIDFLKIDRLFIHDILQGTDDVAIVQSVIDLAHSLGIKVIAEGVDTMEKRHRLVALKCDYYQGFELNEPLLREDATRMLNMRLQAAAER